MCCEFCVLLFVCCGGVSVVVSTSIADTAAPYALIPQASALGSKEDKVLDLRCDAARCVDSWRLRHHRLIHHRRSLRNHHR